MKTAFRRVFVVALCVVLSCATWLAAADDEFDRRVSAIVDAPAFRQATWGILVVDRQTGKVLFERHADKLFAPASTTKLFSVAAALVELGPDFRFETRVVRSGAIDRDGRLEGDLILVASGDLTMGGRTLPDGSIEYTDVDHIYANGSNDAELTQTDPLAGLNHLARQVASAGIRHISGQVVIDDRLFERERGSGSGPATLTPIMINDNLVDIMIRPTQVGESASISWRPAGHTFSFRNNVRTVAAGGEADISIRTEFRRSYIEGTIPEDHPPLVRVHEVRFTTTHAQALFVDALRRAGIEIESGDRRDRPSFSLRRRLPPQEEIAQMPIVARFVSPPFSESAKLILKVSHNLHASTLPLLLAARYGERTLDQGMRIQAEHLKSLGVDVQTISFGGGAGGSNADYVTPRATVQLLLGVDEQPFAEAFQAALPIMGVDGTLADMAPEDSSVRERVQAKTGTLYWRNLMDDGYLLTSKALAGYATAASGRELVFSVVVNNVPLSDKDETSAIGRTITQLCEIFFEWF